MDYTQILSRRFEGEWTLNGDDYAGLTWLSDSPKPSQEEIEAEWKSVQAEIQDEANEKIARRQAILDRLGLTEDEAKLILG